MLLEIQEEAIKPPEEKAKKSKLSWKLRQNLVRLSMRSSRWTKMRKTSKVNLNNQFISFEEISREPIPQEVEEDTEIIDVGTTEQHQSPSVPESPTEQQATTWEDVEKATTETTEQEGNHFTKVSVFF